MIQPMPTLAIWIICICPSVAIDRAERYQNSEDETEPLIMLLERNSESRSCFSVRRRAMNTSGKGARKTDLPSKRQRRQQEWSINAAR